MWLSSCTVQGLYSSYWVGSLWQCLALSNCMYATQGNGSYKCIQCTVDKHYLESMLFGERTNESPSCG